MLVADVGIVSIPQGAVSSFHKALFLRYIGPDFVHFDPRHPQVAHQRTSCNAAQPMPTRTPRLTMVPRLTPVRRY